MSLPENIDQDKLAQTALAILSLGAFEDSVSTRAWKGMDWDLLNVLYMEGWISDPVGKQKSVVLTDEGAALASEYLTMHFGR